MYAKTYVEKRGMSRPGWRCCEGRNSVERLNLQTDASYVRRWEDLRLLECLT